MENVNIENSICYFSIMILRAEKISSIELYRINKRLEKTFAQLFREFLVREEHIGIVNEFLNQSR